MQRHYNLDEYADVFIFCIIRILLALVYVYNIITKSY